eukprot:1355806-Amphidinium_carterae.1
MRCDDAECTILPLHGDGHSCGNCQIGTSDAGPEVHAPLFLWLRDGALVAPSLLQPSGLFPAECHRREIDEPRLAADPVAITDPSTATSARNWRWSPRAL